jgi:hypothetical protein
MSRRCPSRDTGSACLPTSTIRFRQLGRARDHLIRYEQLCALNREATISDVRDPVVALTVVLDAHGAKQLATGHSFSHRCW